MYEFREYKEEEEGGGESLEVLEELEERERRRRGRGRGRWGGEEEREWVGLSKGQEKAREACH